MFPARRRIEGVVCFSSRLKKHNVQHLVQPGSFPKAATAAVAPASLKEGTTWAAVALGERLDANGIQVKYKLELQNDKS